MPEQIVEPRIPGGFVELLPAQQRLFNNMLAIIGDCYEQFGYTPIATPALELIEVLLAKGGGETAQQIYAIAKPNNLALHFDLTVPLARYVAQHEMELPIPFRRYQMQPVWRAEKPQLGRFNEFYQCDFDIVGANSIYYDAEVPIVINAVFYALAIGDFTIRLNNRKILTGLLEDLGCGDRATDVLRIVDKLERDDETVLTGALENLGLDKSQIDRLLAFVAITGSEEELSERLREMPIDSETYHEGVAELFTVMSAVRAAGVPHSQCQIDLKIARGLDYYTGTVYETILNEYPKIGSVCSGGRFDNLAQNYTARDLPGVGASIGLTRLFWQLDRAGLLPDSSPSPARVMVAIVEQSTVEYALIVSAGLRRGGLPVMTYLDPSARLKKQIEHAVAQGIPYLVIVGSSERETNTVTLKILATGQQWAQISLAQAANEIVVAEIKSSA